MLRRDVIRSGGLAVGGLSMPFWANNLAAATGGGALSGKSVIFLFMQGGPSQFETFDPKMDIPVESRTVGGDIKTTIPGVHFGATMHRLARHAHRMSIVRSFSTGTQHGGLRPIVSDTTQGACIGAVYNRVAGTNSPVTGLPNSAVLWPKSVDPGEPGPRTRFGKFDQTGPLGSAYAPFVPGGGGKFQEDMELSIDPRRLTDRRHLLKSLDSIRREIDTSGALDGIESNNQQAFDMLLKGVGKAFDLTNEDPRVIARYDTSHYENPALWRTKTNGTRGNYPAHIRTLGKLLVLARRLCEAGSGFVAINTEFVWDMHADRNNLGVAPGMKVVGRPFDHAVSAFIEDIEARGLSDRILLVCCGEMGRTPRINKNGGRDHWPSLAPLMLYGGGLTHGQVIGRSTRDGGKPDDDAKNPDNLLATILQTLFNLGTARFDQSLPSELRQLFTQMERTPGVV